MNTLDTAVQRWPYNTVFRRWILYFEKSLNKFLKYLTCSTLPDWVRSLNSKRRLYQCDLHCGPRTRPPDKGGAESYVWTPSANSCVRISLVTAIIVASSHRPTINNESGWIQIFRALSLAHYSVIDNHKMLRNFLGRGIPPECGF